MRSETRTQDWFLRDPRCQKWIVQCAGCQAYGRKAATPGAIPKYRFEEMFPIMELDGEGRCQQCQEAEYDSMMETLHLLSTPANARRIQQGLAEYGEGKHQE